ncbi:nuclear pore complex protein Nup133 [Sporothrix schenckii 1099-18]|uniref:Nuclear pore complex protein Nup133 n=1 Tax=Sporothrix schenckii 1099-18 TaxID=1397361 RepID=A0A0F2LU86_SPOSC|nr:nuclear pore complex protein Nup133 [Sporothrix schenckii 1099-18]KJR81017.1 nuclear pore complex protein Nup133 [Sporothrix schenckii 1099-18]
MFSPHEGGPATATRSRRRQRPVSSDSLAQQPKAKRQRLPLTEQTFVNPDAVPEMFQVKADKVAMLSARRDGVENHGNNNNVPPATTPASSTSAAAAAVSTPTTSASAPKKELSVRSKKTKAGERISKGDGSVVLASNNAYTVSKLPALPDRLRTDPGGRQHGTIYSSSGYAVSLTHTHAIVWPYTANSPSPETFTFTLPYPSRHISDPLPLGALVAPAASSEEPGLVVVMPTTGKVSYWESISSAATLDFLRQQRNGVEDVIQGLSSTEHVTEILNAEPAGFILLTSTGRLAYMNVRDGHGRPAISVQFLRTAGGGPSSAGFFGSIRHALKNPAHREDVVAVRAGPHLRVGERSIVAATSKGKFSGWKVHRGGSHDAILETDARDDILGAIRQFDFSADGPEGDSLEVVDFTYVPKGIERKYTDTVRLSNAIEDDNDSTHQLLVLVSLPHKRRKPYYLVELLLAADNTQVGMVRPITSLAGPVSRQQQSTEQRPRVYLPKPAVVAYVVFDRAVVIASLVHPPETPDSQLQGEASYLPPSFEDIVDLRNDGMSEVVGSGVEEPASLLPEAADAGSGAVGSRVHRYKSKNPAAVLIVRGVGVVRVATVDVERFIGEKPPEVTAKSKLEQAVFYGIKDDNPLVFEGKRDSPFSDAEIGEAAMELSRDILGSKTAFTPSVPASLEGNLRTRAGYLDRLMSHLNALHLDLSRRVRWRLLADAEKMFTATNMWLLHEQFMADRADGKTSDRKTIISEIVEYIHEDDKKNPNRDVGEVDRVRYFFVNDVWRMDLFIAWAYEVIKYVYRDHLLDDRGVTRLLYEGVEVNYRALNGATDYRQDKLSFYGLGSEELESGILVDGYDGLPEPWTSTYFITNNAKRLVDLCCNWLDQFYPNKATSVAAPDPGLIESIRESLPNLTDRYLLALLEHYRWTQTRDVESEREYGERCSKAYAEDRYAKVYRLKNYGLWDDAIEVAKKHRSIDALAGIMVEEVRRLRNDAVTVDAGTLRANEKRAEALSKEQRIAEYFDKYGEPFAFAVYEILLRDDGIKAVLDFPGDKKAYATRFLRAKPELAKISWINDVEREKDVESAAGTLLNLGLDRERQVWNKKIELSLGKLALLAEQGASANWANSLLTPPKSLSPAPFSSDNDATSPHNGNNGNGNSDDNIDRVDRQLNMIKIQDLLYSWVLPSIATAVDEAAELQLAMENHATRLPKRPKTLLNVFEDGLSRLLKHEALDAFTLIDLLTLIDMRREETLIEEDVFYLALLVADAGLGGEDRRQAQRLIWRRCFIRDDWAQINNTQLQDDESTASILSQTSVYTTVYALSIQRASSGPLRTLFFENLYANKSEKINASVTFAMVKPSEALGVFSDAADVATTARFGHMEDTAREKLADAMCHEDTLLRRYIDKSRLEDWSRTAKEGAERAMQTEMDRLTELQGSESVGRLKWNLFGPRSAYAHDDEDDEDEDDALKNRLRWSTVRIDELQLPSGRYGLRRRGVV